MPRSNRPQRYPSKCFRIVGLMEARNDSFSLSLPTMRLAVDLRQELYSFQKALVSEAERCVRRKDYATAKRWNRLFEAACRWELSLDPPWDAALLEVPTTLHFHFRDHLPKNQIVEDQLDLLEKSPSAPPTTSPIDEILKKMDEEEPPST